MLSRAAVLIAFMAVLGLPFLVRGLSTGAATRAEAGARAGVRQLVVVTPHTEQIRAELGEAFARWHEREYGEPVYVDWRTPGGTNEIVKLLVSQFEAAARRGEIGPDGRLRPGAADLPDVFFGGGSYEHGKLGSPQTVSTPRGTVTYRMGQPLGWDEERLKEVFGEPNRIGVQNLYDPRQYWVGTALSGFGIVYNRDVVRELGMPEPDSFEDLTDFRYFNMLAMTDPRLSGSITTTYDSILNKQGWDRGWRTLREMGANARYFASAATRAPIDVSQGEAAAGLAIDFYGRGQAQFILAPGQDPASGRVGYVDPAGAVYIDADPVSIVNGAPDAELARRFVEFLLTEEAQVIWQFPAWSSPLGADNPTLPDGTRMGPRRYELRRMPVRRDMYRKHMDRFLDRTNPFEIASDVPSRGWRPAIAPLMVAFAIDTAPEAREAWRVLNLARARAGEGAFPADRLAEMEGAFYAMPVHRTRPGALTPAEIGGLSKDAARAVGSVRPPTIGAITEAVPRLRRDPATPAAVVEELERLVASRPGSERALVLELAVTEANYAAIRLDTASWTDPVHGRRSVIGYTRLFREQYRKVIALGGGI